MNKAIILMAALLVAVAATGLAIGVVPSTVQTAQADPCSYTITGNEDAYIECEFDDDVKIAAVVGNGLTGDGIPLD
jgi:Ca2+-dependent lipid-binding protein